MRRTGIKLAIISIVLVLPGCQTIPDDALRLEESSLEIRVLQSRTYQAPTEQQILTASIGVLQDMEYNIDELEKPLGILTATKTVDATNSGEIAGLLMLDLLCALGGGDCGALASASESQKITLTLVVLPSLNRQGEYVARITLHRVVWDTVGRIKLREPVDDAEQYQQIFDKLSKSVFLEVSTT